MSIRKANPPEVAPPVGDYCHLAVVPAGSDLLVLAGQVGVDRSGALPAEVDAQLRNALANALAILSSEGLGPDAVIKVNLWLVGKLDRQDFLRVWQGFHQGSPPPTTYAYVAGLARPEFQVEVEVWAARAPSTG